MHSRCWVTCSAAKRRLRCVSRILTASGTMRSSGKNPENNYLNDFARTRCPGAIGPENERETPTWSMVRRHGQVFQARCPEENRSNNYFLCSKCRTVSGKEVALSRSDSQPNLGRNQAGHRINIEDYKKERPVGAAFAQMARTPRMTA